jgi:predicted metal-dependent hydrolase
MLAADGLTRGAIEQSEPEMRDLLAWHAVEELEHKAVAFEVLRAVEPSYLVRIAGLGLACVGLAAYWSSASRALLASDGVSLPDAYRALHEDGAPPFTDLAAIGRGLLAYLHPDFHPDDVDHSRLVETTLASLEAREVLAA